MRSTFLGSFIGNICARLGHKTTRLNYLGDWGTQYGKYLVMFSNVYFFKDFLCEIKFQGILAVGFKKYGSYEELNRSPIKHLLEVIFHRKSALYKHTELNFKIF
jgi:arginyl-tRNA synthetase